MPVLLITGNFVVSSNPPLPVSSFKGYFTYSIELTSFPQVNLAITLECLLYLIESHSSVTVSGFLHSNLSSCSNRFINTFKSLDFCYVLIAVLLKYHSGLGIERHTLRTQANVYEAISIFFFSPSLLSNTRRLLNQ